LNQAPDQSACHCASTHMCVIYVLGVVFETCSDRQQQQQQQQA